MMESEPDSYTDRLRDWLRSTLHSACSSGFLPIQSETSKQEGVNMGTAMGNASYPLKDSIGSSLTSDGTEWTYAEPVDSSIIMTTDGTNWVPNQAGDVVWVDDLPAKQQHVPSYPVSGIAYPFYSQGMAVEPERKKCNFCGTETADFRELRIGRMTNVVVCDMCMLKALSKTLTEVDKDGGDEGGSGDCKCGADEKDCGHGCEEGKEEGKKECSP